MDLITAAALAAPSYAKVTDGARLRLLGYDGLPLRPICFVVPDDHHVALDGVLVHRTKLVPPVDDVGVTPAAAFLGCCAEERTIDLIAAGDWLVRNGHARIAEIADLATSDGWRPGAARARAILPQLNPRARSPRESKVRAYLVAAGLPAPEVNVELEVGGRMLGCVDLLYRRWMLVIEYEGRQHAEDEHQFNVDISRYERFRDHHVTYVQVTNARFANPRAMVMLVHQKLVACGYDGPAPSFGRRWRDLIAPVEGAHARRR
ncbi:hypothetical protein FE697_019245 [Mumia zhuanghuii]|uniref:DUF559 domain-containing protein n=2 Tax=Mumia TaxID=1546255 RepID=A0ABW1QN70_9ACTN|nr:MULTISPECIES: hypothetical protein [Mumia]KAA1420017.1 hypothetical protein FE697_019245 [Mumia zhuanghuii]